MQINQLLRASAAVTLLATSPLAAQEVGQRAHHLATAVPAAPPAAKPAPTTMPAMPGANPAMGQGGMTMPPGGSGERGMAMMRDCMGMMGKMIQGMGDGGMATPSMPDDPVAGAFAAINNRMHRDMAVPAGAKPDAVFAQAMIAHHQGAIDMAKVILGFGTDPEIHKLAQDVITAQEGEIAFLQEWLARQPPQ